MLFLKGIKLLLGAVNRACLKLVHLGQKDLLLASFLKLTFHTVQLILFGLNSLVNEVVLLSQSLQSRWNFHLLNTSSFPLRDEIIWLQQSVPGHTHNFSLVLFTLRHRVLLLELFDDAVDVRLAWACRGWGFNAFWIHIWWIFETKECNLITYIF